MFVERAITSQLLKLINNFPAVGIVGPRQVGKTTLAKHLMNQIDRECIYLDLELEEDQSKLYEPQLYLEQHVDKCVVLDEIQQMPHLFPVLRGLIDKKRVPGRFIILGSASPDLLKQSSESLAGRIVYQVLNPFNLTEVAADFDMNSHWFKGGFPESFLLADEELHRIWIRNFIRTYIERDLPMLGLSVTPILMRRLWSMLAHFHGGIWNASNFARALGVTIPTINRYVEFLESAFIIHRLQPYYTNIKKRLVKSPKIYIRDSGILHHLVGIISFEDLQGNVIIGNSWEGYVIEQIKQIVPGEIDLYYYRTHNGTESDLILTRGNKVIACIEIKYTTAPRLSKGFLIAINDLKSKTNFIITPKSETYQIHENVTVCSLLEFLSKHIINLYGT
ncbi:MAG: ATP-binding protein [Calditrichaeota bacterium]|nr:ATP-binding protein [Calditrichota bacterium]